MKLSTLTDPISFGEMLMHNHDRVEQQQQAVDEVVDDMYFMVHVKACAIVLCMWGLMALVLTCLCKL